MKEAFTKENIENWLVEFLTTPTLTGCDHPSADASLECYNIYLKEHEYGTRIVINPPNSNWPPLNIFNGHGANIGINRFPERALALLAIIHRPAYEFYKKHWIEK